MDLRSCARTGFGGAVSQVFLAKHLLRMKTIANDSDKNALLDRLRRVNPSSQRRWGKMTPHQMVVHLNDSFKSVIGERKISVRQTNAVARALIRWIALYAPFKWPHGVPTMPENDPERGGTSPDDFKRDVEALAAMIERLTRAEKDFQMAPSSALRRDVRA